MKRNIAARWIVTLVMLALAACSTPKLVDVPESFDAGSGPGEGPSSGGPGHGPGTQAGRVPPSRTPAVTGNAIVPPPQQQGQPPRPRPIVPRQGEPFVAPERFEVRLAGDDVAGATSAWVNVAALHAWADGYEVQTRIDAAAVDLCSPGAHRVATFELPPGTRAVRFQLELDDVGGYAPLDPSMAGGVQARQVPIAWTSQVDWLRARGRAVVHLDVARSFARGDDGWVLLPQLEVLYR